MPLICRQFLLISQVLSFFCVKQVDREVSEMSNHHANNVEVGRREMIEAKLEEIVKNINENRKHHADTLEKFKKELDKQARNDGKLGRRN